MAISLQSHPEIRCGTFEWRGPATTTTWHHHPHHQLEYALAGVARVQTDAGTYLLPPQQAIWIPAGLEHLTTLQSVHSIALFLDPGFAPMAGDRALVIAVPPIVREMLVYGLRWPIQRGPGSPADAGQADQFFRSLASIIAERLVDESPLHLPSTVDAVLARVLELTEATLPTVKVDDVCAAVGLSERTLRRRSLDGIGMTWQGYVVRSRLVRAAALLAEGDRSVLDVAAAVGYESQSSFARAFRRWMGDSPSGYRHRIRSQNAAAGGGPGR